MVGVEDAWADDTQQPSKAQNLHRPEAGKFMQAEFGGFWRKRGIGGTGEFHGPTPVGQALGEGEALVVRSATPQAGVQLEHAGDEG